MIKISLEKKISSLRAYNNLPVLIYNTTMKPHFFLFNLDIYLHFLRQSHYVVLAGLRTPEIHTSLVAPECWD